LLPLSAHTCTELANPLMVFQPDTPALKVVRGELAASVPFICTPEPRLLQVEASDHDPSMVYRETVSAASRLVT
jgi:hypothetical protein